MEIDAVGPDVISYQNTGLAEATTYNYRVLAYNAAGESGYSNAADAMTRVTLAGPLAFVAQLPGPDSEIQVMNPDGSVTPLTASPGGNVFPAWSRDRTRIAFSSDRDSPGVNSEIYVMNADGSSPNRLTIHPANDGCPAWSPDDTKIAFSSDRDGPGVNNEIYVMNADGSGSPIRLTDHPADDNTPAWSPDGSKIIFDSDRDDPGVARYVYMMNADGSNATRLTTNRSSLGASWCGSQIFYSESGSSIRRISENGTGDTPIGVLGLEPTCGF